MTPIKSVGSIQSIVSMTDLPDDEQNGYQDNEEKLNQIYDKVFSDEEDDGDDSNEILYNDDDHDDDETPGITPNDDKIESDDNDLDGLYTKKKGKTRGK